ncbi:MAG: hypothetical protein CL610_24375 [Anaerolineaceae bacterium]|nr:hypothetical protein [Anaerolineaceae bacterium]
MANRSKFDLQLEHILITIANDYNLPLTPPGWQKPGDLQMPLNNLAEHMNRYGVMVMVADKHGHDEISLKQALLECTRMQGQFYDYMVTQLYATQSGKPMEANYYEADDFLVLVMTAGVAPVIEVMGLQLIPFVVEYYRQPEPPYRVLLRLADLVLEDLYAEPEQSLHDAIITRIRPMLSMKLRPLRLIPSVFTPAPPPADMLLEGDEPSLEDQRLDDEFEPDTGDNPAAQEPRRTQPASVSRRTLRAPLPDWRSDNRPER